MWTNNGKLFFLRNLINMLEIKSFKTSLNTDYDTNRQFHDIADYANMNKIKTIESTYDNSSFTNTNFGVFCGSGDTAPTPEDYTLAEPLSLDYVASSLSSTVINKVIQYTVQNNNSTPVTIRELGLCAMFVYLSDNKIILLNRKVLDTPITLAVGEQAIITFTIDTSNILGDGNWTNNFKIFANNQFIKKEISTDYIDITGVNSTNSNVNRYTYGIITSNSAYTPIENNIGSANQSTFAIYVGTGTTPPTENDYTLEAPVSLTYQYANLTIDNNYNGIISYTLQNTTTETITISEIGLFAGLGRTGKKWVMMSRKLLPTPVVMNPNDNYVFTFTINTSNLTE